MVVSHLNAHVVSGMKWLDGILLPGLRQGGGSCEWEVEIHGNGKEEEEEEEARQNERASVPKDQDDESSGSSQEEESLGPAVYIAHKLPPLSTTTNQADSVVEGSADQTSPQSNDDDTEKSHIPLRFFTY